MRKERSSELRVQGIKKTTEFLLETLIKKNHDYGNSFGQSYRKYGDLSSVIRLTDKLNRLEVLGVQRQSGLVNESLSDTYLDIAGYAILAYVERELLIKEDDERATKDISQGGN